jgi:hypothetical protein
MNKEEQIRSLDACLICLDQYKTAGSFEMAIKFVGMMNLIASVREELAKNTPWEGKMSTMEEMMRPSAEEVAAQILKEINGG